MAGDRLARILAELSATMTDAGPRLYRDRPRSLSDDQHADASAGSGAAELQEVADLHCIGTTRPAWCRRSSASAAPRPSSACAAYAFSNDRLLRDVADDVVAHLVRRLRTLRPRWMWSGRTIL